MRLRVLGPVALEPTAGEDEAGALAPRLRRLLAALAVHRNAVVSVDALAEVVWGDQQPSSPEAALHNLVSRLRAAMRTTGPAATVLTRAPGYLLRVEPTDLDAMRFERLAGRGRDELVRDPSSAAESLQEALALWHGAAYAEFADEEFARPEAGLRLPSDPMTGGYLRMMLAETALFEGRLADVERHRTEVAALAVEADLGAVELLNDLLAPLVTAYGGDSQGAARQAEELQRSAARRGAAPIEAWARYLRGEALIDSDPEAATRLLDGAVSLAREHGDRYSGGVALVSAASVRGRHGDPRSAVPLFAEVIEHWRTTGDWTHQWTSLRGVVDVLVRLGREEDAAVLRGALLDRTSAPPVFGADAERMAATGALLSQRLGEDVARELGRRGARMTDDEVVDFARRALDEVRGPAQRSR
jgi:hypothetical protein